jgi:outer membrane protein OmpA-like peptidoglycan-associated protein
MGGMCTKKKEEEEDGALQRKTYQDYLDERGYVPLCCDNTGKDLWIIACCFGWLYSLVLSFYCVVLKAVLLTAETSAALWMFFYCFCFGAIMILFAIYGNNISKIPAPQEVEEIVAPIEIKAALSFTVGGHTNKASSPEQAAVALRLSNERAASVVAVFVGSGCKKSQVVPKGYGDQMPNKYAKNEYDNMRVECSLDDTSGLTKALKNLGYPTTGRVVLEEGNEFGGSGIAIEISGGRATLLHDAILFQPNNSVLTADGEALAKRIAMYLKKLEAAAK